MNAHNLNDFFFPVFACSLAFVLGYRIGLAQEKPICVTGEKVHFPEAGDCYVFPSGNYFLNGEKLSK